MNFEHNLHFKLPNLLSKIAERLLSTNFHASIVQLLNIHRKWLWSIPNSFFNVNECKRLFFLPPLPCIFMHYSFKQHTSSSTEFPLSFRYVLMLNNYLYMFFLNEGAVPWPHSRGGCSLGGIPKVLLPTGSVGRQVWPPWVANRKRWAPQRQVPHMAEDLLPPAMPAKGAEGTGWESMADF